MTRLAVDLHITAPVAIDATFNISGFTALLGRSGAGKTTILKALAGLIPASGAPFGALPAHQRHIGYLPQTISLFPHLTALENTAYALRGAGRFTTARAMLGELGLAALADRPAPALSGGQASRIALARALASTPQLLLLDEPGAALDAPTRETILTWLIDTLAARRIPALAATHDPTIAGRADHLVLLAGGRIIAQGPPAQLYDQPGTAAAAQLLGFENILNLAGALYAIRAADILIAATGIPADIQAIRPHGAALHVTCTMPAPVVLHTRPDALYGRGVGERIHLVLPEAARKRLA
jgi:ABC-type sulfate/molybdate transport systems ATPase subunit